MNYQQRVCVGIAMKNEGAPLQARQTIVDWSSDEELDVEDDNYNHEDNDKNVETVIHTHWSCIRWTSLSKI